MIKNQKVLNQIQRLAEEEFPSLQQNILISVENNSYEVFGNYLIKPSGNGSFLVIKNNVPCGEFSSTRSSLSWCIADKCNQLRLRDEILLLDSKKIMLTADLFVRSTLVAGFKNYTTRSATDIKISARRDRLSQVTLRLDKCVNLAKYWQIRGFNNETARPGRTPTNRTNR
jgi:hypothetical protein